MDYQKIDPAGLDQLGFTLDRCQGRWTFRRTQQLNRMRIECQDSRRQPVPARMIHQAGKHLLMPAMDSVKITDRQETIPVPRSRVKTSQQFQIRIRSGVLSDITTFLSIPSNTFSGVIIAFIQL